MLAIVHSVHLHPFHLIRSSSDIGGCASTLDPPIAVIRTNTLNPVYDVIPEHSKYGGDKELPTASIKLMSRSVGESITG